MSLIHQALERVEQEKKGLPLPPPRDLLSLPPREIREKKFFFEENAQLIYGIAGAFLLLFDFGLIYLFGRSSLMAPPSPSTVESSVTPAAAPKFKSWLFSLTGITRVGEDLTAIVNNELVRVGDEVSGAIVKEIQDGKVVLDYRGETITLSLYGH